MGREEKSSTGSIVLSFFSLVSCCRRLDWMLGGAMEEGGVFFIMSVAFGLIQIRDTKKKYINRLVSDKNRVRRHSGFPTFIMAQRHHVRTSATRSRCVTIAPGENLGDVSMVSLVVRWPVGQCFGPYLICGFARGRRTLLTVYQKSISDSTNSVVT